MALRPDGAEWAGLSVVRPPEAEAELPCHEHAILSVVPREKAFEGEGLVRLLDFAGTHFRQGVVLVADGLAQLLGRMADQDVDERAWRLDCEVALNEVAPLFEGSPCRFQYRMASTLLEQDACTPFRDSLNDAFHVNQGFQENLKALATEWLEHVSYEAKSHWQEACMAMLNHLAVLALLRSQGWGLHVHPGMSPTLRWMNGERWPKLPGNLATMVFVELAPRIYP